MVFCAFFTVWHKSHKVFSLTVCVNLTVYSSFVHIAVLLFYAKAQSSFALIAYCLFILNNLAQLTQRRQLDAVRRRSLARRSASGKKYTPIFNDPFCPYRLGDFSTERQGVKRSAKEENFFLRKNFSYNFFAMLS